MTKQEALLALLRNFEVGTRTVDFDYDPAGSTTSYIPDPRDVAIVQAFIKRDLIGDDFSFNTGAGPYRSCYHLRRELIEEIAREN